MLTVLLAALTALSSVFRDAAASDYVTLRGLLEAGLVLPDARDSDGETLLMRMSSRAQPPLVQLLLEHGADVSLTDEKGCSALMCAALRLASDLRLNWRSPAGGLCLVRAADARGARWGVALGPWHAQGHTPTAQGGLKSTAVYCLV